MEQLIPYIMLITLLMNVRFIYQLSCSFQSGKYGKEEENFLKIEDLENQKSFFDEIKSIFQSL